MPEVAHKFRECLSRPLTEPERNLVRWLIDHSHTDARHLLPQVDKLSVYAKCTCGCPTIDFALCGEPVETKGEKLVSDWIADVDGMPVGVMLWQANVRISTLEVYSLPGSDKPFGLPAIESFLGY